MRDTVTETGLPVLAGNLTCDGVAPYAAHRVVERGGRRIGLLGVTGGSVEGCEIGDPVAAVERAVAAMGPVDVRILLWPLDARSNADPARLTLPVDLVVDGATGRPASRPEPSGTAWILGSGDRGRQLGTVELAFGDGPGWAPSDGETAVRDELARLEKRLGQAKERRLAATDPAVVARFAAQEEHYAAQLAEARARLEAAGDRRAGSRFTARRIDLTAAVPDHRPTHALVEAAKREITELEASASAPPPPVPSSFAGAEACRACHAGQHDQWRDTAHARAYASLVSVSRHLDHDCWSCHVTGAGAEGGPHVPAAVGGLRDVQCEACHGPAAAHVVDPVRVRPLRRPEASTCLQCHDEKQDMGRFDLDAYWPKIVH